MQRYLIHIVCGSTGAGKTTYAQQLAKELGAVIFSIDEWMAALFWVDKPEPIDPAWAMERVERCNRQIWATAAKVAGRGVPCILDLGFSQAESRARFAGLAKDAGLPLRLHFVDVPAEERWRRVQARNAAKDETYQLTFDVTREMFDFVETLWQPPTEEEMNSCNGLRIEP